MNTEILKQVEQNKLSYRKAYAQLYRPKMRKAKTVKVRFSSVDGLKKLKLLNFLFFFPLFIPLIKPFIKKSDNGLDYYQILRIPNIVISIQSDNTYIDIRTK